MNLHPRIEELFELIENQNIGLNSESIKQIIKHSVTKTELIITLHLCYSMSWEDAESFIRQFDGFKSEASNDSLYFTMTYMYYNQ